MRIASWNVNSLNVRLPHVLQWLSECEQAGQTIDLLCLQELKLPDEKFPLAALQAIGYHSIYHGQKTYNGVAILSRLPLNVNNIQKNNPLFEDVQSRMIACTVSSQSIGEVRVICVYVPNGERPDSEKYHYKLQWLHALRKWLQMELAQYPRLVIVGDFNIAPADNDVLEIEKWQGQILVSSSEREQWQNLLALSLFDAYRALHPHTQQFTWWDYRAAAFRRNFGARIDHILYSSALKAVSCVVDTSPRQRPQPSDHTPIWADIGLVAD